MRILPYGFSLQHTVNKSMICWLPYPCTDNISLEEKCFSELFTNLLHRMISAIHKEHKYFTVNDRNI